MASTGKRRRRSNLSGKVCSIPHNQVRVDDLERQIEESAVSPHSEQLTVDGWFVAPPAVEELLSKVERRCEPLSEVCGKPSYGIKTGANEIFLIDAAKRAELIAEHASSAKIIKPYFRGQDVERWYAEPSGDFMVFSRRGIEIDNYPAVKRYLREHRTRLKPKPDWWDAENKRRLEAGGAEVAWRGRKAGSYKWYEIQDAVDYWEDFEKPKVVYQEIQTYPRYTYDDSGAYTNNKAFIIPTEHQWVAGILNSPFLWWRSWYRLPHMANDTLTPRGDLVVSFPMPKARNGFTEQCSKLVHELTAEARTEFQLVVAIHDWLRMEYGVEKRTRNLDSPLSLTPDKFVDEVKKSRRKTMSSKAAVLSMVDLKRLREEYARTIEPATTRRREVARLERELANLVNAAYGLTPDDIKLMWQTRPPRMPVGPPPEL